MSDLGLAANTLDCRGPVADGQLSGLVQRAWATRSSTREQLVPAVETMKHGARRNVELVTGLLGNGPTT